MSEREIVARFLGWLSQELAKMTDEEFARVLESRIRLIDLKGRRKTRSATKPKYSQDEVAALVSKLRNLKSREEGEALLSSESKENLERVARHLDLPVLREDSGERVREKIVHATIGYQIVSDAIRKPE